MGLQGKRVASWPQGLILVLQAILPTMGPMLLVPSVPLLFETFGKMPNATFWIPALLTVPALCIALFAIPAGWLGDRIGRRPTLMFALLFYGFAGIAPLFLSSFETIFASRVVLGLAEAVIITLSATLIGDYFEGAPRARWLAMISTIATLSAVLLLMIGGFLGATYGWRGPFAVYGLAFLFLPLMVLFTWEPTARPDEIAQSEQRVAFPLRHLAVTAIVTAFGSVLFYTLALEQGRGLSELGLQDPARIGLLAGIASLANLLGTLVFRRFVAAPTGLMLTVAFLFLGGGLVWMANAPAIAGMANAPADIVFAGGASLGLFGAGLLFPTLITWTMRELPFVFRGVGTGVFQAVFMGGQFGSTIAIAMLVQQVTGGVLPAFGIIGGAALIAALAALASTLLVKKRPAVN
jgi:predicted MFS family arabinose efflux permease